MKSPQVSAKILARVIQKINKSFGKDSDTLPLTTFQDSIFSKPSLYIHTGILPLDCIFGSGKGVPDGIIEIWGPEGVGKSAILESILAEAQRRGYYTILFPMEYSLEPSRIRSVGLDEKQLIMGEGAETIEDIYDLLKSYVVEIRKNDPNAVIVVGWDTVAATPTGSEITEGLAKTDMGKFAALMSRFFRRLVRFLRKNHVCLVCINQERDSLNPYGPKTTTPGGRAIRFYAWIRARIRVVERIKSSSGKEIGIMSEIGTVKNKSGTPPFQKCLLPIYFSRGIDATEATWEYAKELGVIVRKGTKYTLNGGLVTRKSFAKLYAKRKNKINKLVRIAARKQMHEDSLG